SKGGNLTVLDYATNPSQEFVLEIKHNFIGLQNNYFATLTVTDFAFIEKDIFSDAIGFLGDVVGDVIDTGGNVLNDLARMIVAPLTSVLSTLIRWLGDIIGGFLGLLQAALEVALTALGVLLEGAIDALQPLLTLIETAVDAVATVVQDVVDEIIALGIK
ncbi:MAG: hypothetical protein ACW980_24750, partial [Promethearchaeota archaeon]